jgi:ArsR family transcriptional regulator
MADVDENQSQRASFGTILPRAIDLMAQYFGAIAHPMRLRIAMHLSQRDLTVMQLVEALALSEPVVSRHVALLRQVGVLTRHRDGKRVLNRLTDDTIMHVCEIAARLELERQH